MKKIIAAITLTAILLLSVGVSYAQIINPDVVSNLPDQLAPQAGFSQTVGVGYIIAILVRAALGILAAIFLILMIIAGFGWMTAGGDEAKVKKAQDTIKTALIGLVIVLAAYAITYFVFRYLPFTGGSAPQGGGSGVNP